jgi:hypothetical protein
MFDPATVKCMVGQRRSKRACEMIASFAPIEALLLGFASAAPKAIRAGVDRLAIVLAGLLKDRRPRPTDRVARREIQNVRH